jgi:uncharacterized protein
MIPSDAPRRLVAAPHDAPILMDWTPYALGWCSAVLVGLSKTGLPGVSIPAIWLMTEAFPDDARLAVGALLPVLLLGDCFAVGWYRHHAQWNRLWRLFPAVVLGMLGGAVLLHCLEEGNDLRPILGGLILGLLVLEGCRRWFAWQNVPHQWWFVGGVGALAGFSTFVAHAAFPVMTIYLLSQGLPKQQFIGTAAWFFLIVNLAKVPFYTWSGMVTAETLRFDVWVAPAAALGGLLGIYLLRRIPQRAFEAIALTLAAVAALRLLTA